MRWFFNLLCVKVHSKRAGPIAFHVSMDARGHTTKSVTTEKVVFDRRRRENFSGIEGKNRTIILILILLFLTASEQKQNLILVNSRLARFDENYSLRAGHHFMETLANQASGRLLPPAPKSPPAGRVEQRHN